MSVILCTASTPTYLVGSYENNSCGLDIIRDGVKYLKEKFPRISGCKNNRGMPCRYANKMDF